MPKKQQQAEETKAAKVAELTEAEVYEAVQDENPFVRPQRVRVVEVKKNAAEVAWVKYQPFDPGRTDVVEPLGYLPEGEFRAQYPNKVNK